MKRLLLVLLTLATVAQAEQIDTLIEGGTVVTMNAARQIFSPGYVAISNGKIIEVGKGSSELQAKQKIDARGRAVIPGLINGHTHLPMVLFRGLADDLKIKVWLENVIFPAEAQNVTPEFVRVGTRLGLAEMIRGGITTYADMYYFEEVIAEETSNAGVRAVLGQTVLDFPAPDRKTWSDMLTATRRFVESWNDDPLITPAIAPHAPYTVSKDHWFEVKTLAEELDVPILTHLSEAPMELEYTHEHYRMRPIPFLESLGLLSPRLLGAHVIYANRTEREVLRKRGVGIVHCPESNMKVAVGVSPVPDLIEEGVRLGLGSDGAASNNNLDLWQEMNSAAKLHKIHRLDPTVLKAEEVFALATIGGARALQMDNEIGSLEKGKWADIAIIDLEKAHLKPLYNLYSALVYAVRSDDVTHTIVAGELLYNEKRLLTIDEKQTFRDVDLLKEEIRKSVGR